MITSNERTISSLTHLSALTQYFFPFGNFICPIVIWSSKKNDSEFIDYNGKQVLNFQLSIFAYSILALLIAVPLLIFGFVKNVSTNSTFNSTINFDNINFDNFSNHKITSIIIVALIAGTVFIFLKLIEFILIVYAAVKALNGEHFKYPLTIPFFK
jgi:uncharacterized Tic20 family protein